MSSGQDEGEAGGSSGRDSRRRHRPTRIILGVTGSVAAVRAPKLYRTLTEAGHLVRVVATEPSLYFFDPAEIKASTLDADPSTNDPETGGPLFRDRHEWPEPRYVRGDPVRHIAFRDWADTLVVAPLDANTLAKFALGLADNFLTCLFRAWNFAKPVILAPAMNTLMWESPVTRRHLTQILEDRASANAIPRNWTLAEAAEIFAEQAPGIVLVPPQAKTLACGDFGIGAMAEVPSIAEAVRATLGEVEV